MASKVEICNLALSHVGAYRISSLSDTTKEAKECSAFYDIALNATLEDYDWSFARKRLPLALLSETYSGWDFAYQYPIDCIIPRKISDPTGVNTGTSYDIDSDRYNPVGKVKYELAVSGDLSSRIILTNKEDAELVYTAKVTNTNLFTNQFIDAFSLKLAAYLAQPLKGKDGLRIELLQLYANVVNRSQAVDANSDYREEESANTFVSSRH
jgi:hypothetical protein